MKQHYVISARHYFDKRYGNSYYTLRIMGNDGTDTIVPFTYGHGDLTYLHRAGETLGIDTNAMSWEERRQTFTIEETKVTRRRDLHNGGRRRDLHNGGK